MAARAMHRISLHGAIPADRNGAVRNARGKCMTAVHSGKTGRKLETANLNGCFARILPDMSAFLCEIWSRRKVRRLKNWQPGISNNADQVKQLLRDRALAALDRPQSQLPAILCFDIVGGGSRIWRSQRRRNSWATSSDTLQTSVRPYEGDYADSCTRPKEGTG